MESILQQELETYDAVKPSLLPKEQGRFVLIYKDRVIGLFDDEVEAGLAGYSQLGNVPFLVQEVQEVEVPETIYIDPWNE